MFTIGTSIQSVNQSRQGRAQTFHVLPIEPATQLLGGDENLQPGHRLWIGECLPRRTHQLFGIPDLRRIRQHLERCDQAVNGVFYYRSQQAISVPEVMLNDSPADAGSLDDVPSAGSREPFFADTPNGLVDE